MRSFFLAIGIFLSMVAAVIVGIFGALLIFNKLWNRDKKPEPDPSILAEWDLIKTRDNKVIKPVLVEYEPVEIRDSTGIHRTSVPVLVLTWITDGENVGSIGFEVDGPEQADEWMSALTK